MISNRELAEVKQSLEDGRDREQEIKDSVQRLKKSRVEIQQEIRVLEREHKEAIDEIRIPKDNIAKAKARIQQLDDEKYQRIRRLIDRGERNMDKAVKWVEENRKHFESDVYGPIICEVNIKDGMGEERRKLFSNYIEQHVSFNIWSSFVCTSQVVRWRETHTYMYIY